MKRKEVKRKIVKGGGLAIFVGYVWSKTLAGLAIHPYKSVKEMILERESRVLLPVVMSPVLALIGFLVVGRVGAYLWEFEGLEREILALGLAWGLVGLLLWQGLMIVLVWRFVRTLR